MGAFHLVANPHAPRAQDAPVVIHHKHIVRSIYDSVRIKIREPDMHHSLIRGEALQVTVVIRDTDRANMISFGEQQFQNHQTIFA
jgi:hypothetical protein